MAPKKQGEIPLSERVHPKIVEIILGLLEDGLTPEEVAKVTRQSKATVLAVGDDMRPRKRPTGPDPDDPIDQMLKACNDIGALVVEAVKAQAVASAKIAEANPEGSVILLTNVLDTSDRLFVRRGQDSASGPKPELPRVVPANDPA